MRFIPFEWQDVEAPNGGNLIASPYFVSGQLDLWRACPDFKAQCDLTAPRVQWDEAHC